MKDLLGALAFATAFTFAQSASALVITATLDSFESTPVTLNGVGTGGGRGTFTLTGSDAVIPTNLASILDASFQAVCLEPNSYVTVGQTYNFLVTDLAFAPTITGGMGAAREAIIEDRLGRTGLTSVEDMTINQVAFGTVALYEAGYEAQANTLDPYAGTATFSGAAGVVADGATFLASTDPMLYDVDAFALINIGVAGNYRTRTVFEGQDFAVFTASAVPSPAPLALFGLGMLGLVGMKRFRA